ncbi:hypothetical protein QUW50_13180 [Barnesiella viscericola]|uniref:hypothetical protein n=1 Tax=Barnesiella viscericola TaxID=397865 RepID=UPI0025A37868|nr:hypothetical protein [Barnesiella viscericola]MDM8269978.1 hypothetical protein [Barnesiella viscericola]
MKGKKSNITHSFIPNLEKVELKLCWIRRIWYVIVLAGTSIYVFTNFSELVNFTFFNQFNGKNLIFILWLVLILIPLFDNFEGFGIRFNTHKIIESNKIPSQLADNVLKSAQKTSAELKDEMEKIISKEEK